MSFLGVHRFVNVFSFYSLLNSLCVSVAIAIINICFFSDFDFVSFLSVHRFVNVGFSTVFWISVVCVSVAIAIVIPSFSGSDFVLF